MKLLATGDLHLRGRNPENRLGDWFNDQSEKVYWVLDLAEQLGVRAILQPGDLGDAPLWSEYLKQYYISALRQVRILWYGVRGQHDVFYHSLSSWDRTSMSVLEAAGVYKVLSDKPVALAEYKYKQQTYSIQETIGHVEIFGASWGEPVPAVRRRSPDTIARILVIHQMITCGGELYPGQTDRTEADEFLERHAGFDLIVTGDNHLFCWAEKDGRWLVNCGTLMRLSAGLDSYNHQPRVAVYDTIERTVDWYEVPCRPAEEVLDRERVEAGAAKDERMDVFIENLQERAASGEELELGLDFRRNLDEFVVAHAIREGTRRVLSKVLPPEEEGR